MFYRYISENITNYINVGEHEVGNLDFDYVKLSDADGIGFAVPINIVKPVLETLEKEGKISDAYLGIYAFDSEVLPYLESNLKFEKLNILFILRHA